MILLNRCLNEPVIYHNEKQQYCTSLSDGNNKLAVNGKYNFAH
jgi:hypothetical protein